MDDRELLELAAKAAGYNAFAGHAAQILDSGWNPLTDDGDALRLAVKLELGIDIVEAHTAVMSRDERVCVVDRCTRRAIVRAAAAIGRDM